jgi:DNA-binding transcriptional regulator YdaS (Cro superfamily)
MDLHQYLSSERGRQAALAKAIGAHAPDVSRWADGKRPVPFEYGAAIEAATGGAVTRKELFPNDWQRLWPELADTGADSDRRSLQERRAYAERRHEPRPPDTPDPPDPAPT